MTTYRFVADATSATTVASKISCSSHQRNAVRPRNSVRRRSRRARRGGSEWDYSVLGLGAVVIKDVPDGAIVAGNPAQVIGSIAGFALS